MSVAIESPATANHAPPVSRAAPISAFGNATKGCSDARRSCGASTSRPSDPAMCATTVVATGSTARATSATAPSGTASTRRSTPLLALDAPSCGTTSTSHPTDRSAPPNEPPARPRPMIRMTGIPRLQRLYRGHPAVDVVVPALGQQVRSDVVQRYEHEGALEHAGVRNQQVRLVDRLAVDPEDVDVERARSPSFPAHPAGGRLDAVAHPEQLASGGSGLDGHDHVQERILSWRTADRICLVQAGHGDDARERIDGL